MRLLCGVCSDVVNGNIGLRIPPPPFYCLSIYLLLTKTYITEILHKMLMEAIRECLMAFIFVRKNQRGKTWYVGYYVNGKFLRKRVGRSKIIAEKARGNIEAKVEKGKA